MRRSVPTLLVALALPACSVVESRTDASLIDAPVPPTVDAPRPDIPIRDTGFIACETARSDTSPIPATLVLQLDTSGSMNCAASERSCVVGDPTAAPDDSRYDVLRLRLLDALTALPDATRVGLMHYPGGRSACAPTSPLVPIAELGTNRTALASALGSLVPANVTPTHDAVMAAFAILRSDAGERRFQVLATDGRATLCLGCDAACSFDEQDADDRQMVEDIRRAHDVDGIDTFVIGVPGSQGFRAILSDMAEAGGTARSPGCTAGGPSYCHFDLTDAGTDLSTGLRDALAAIGESVLSCEYEIPPNPDGAFDAGLVNVVLVEEDGTERVVGRDRSRASGWDYSDDGLRIVLHGAACDDALALRGGRIDVQFGCPTELF